MSTESHINVINLSSQNELVPSRENIFLFWENGHTPWKKVADSGRADITKTALWTTCKFNPNRPVYLFSNSAKVSDYDHKDVNFTIVRYTFKDLVRDTPLDRNEHAKLSYGWDGINPRIVCDVIRILLIYKYGGTYVDTDNVCVKPIVDSPSNIISRTFDLADSHWCNILPETKYPQPQPIREATLNTHCFDGRLRENGLFPEKNFFVRMDGWVNWEPRHKLPAEMLGGQLFNDRGEHFGYGSEFWAYAPPTWLYRTLIDHYEDVMVDSTFGLTLLYLYEVFMNRDFAVTHGWGEMLEIYYETVPGFDGTHAMLKGRDVEGLTWGEGMQVTEDIANKFLDKCKVRFPYASFLWMNDKEENADLRTQDGPARVSSWIYRISRKATGF